MNAVNDEDKLTIFKHDFPEFYEAIQLMIIDALRPRQEHAAANPMIAEALAKGEDATGLCTVRECAETLYMSSFSKEYPFGKRRNITELDFTHKGKRYNVEMIVTKVEDMQ